MTSSDSLAGQSPDELDVAATLGTAAQGAEEALFLSCAESLRELAGVAERSPVFADAVRAALAAPGVDTAAPTGDALALIDDLLAIFMTVDKRTGWTYGTSVRADKAEEWHARRAALAASTPQPSEPTDDALREEAAARLRAMAEHHANLGPILRGIAQWMTYVVLVEDNDAETARATASARALLGSS